MSDEPPVHHPFPWRLTAIVAAVVIVATVAAGLLMSRDRVQVAPPTPSPSASASVAPTPVPPEAQRQVTMLVIVRDAQRRAVSNVLIGVGGGTDAVAELMLPRDLLLPTTPPSRLADSSDPTGPRSPGVPLQTLLGVQVDAVLDLDRLAWNGLVDATGASDRFPSAQSPSAFGLVLDGVLEELPKDPGTAGQLLTSLGSMARITVTNEDAARVLALIGQGLRTLPTKRAWLPTTLVRSGDAQVAVADLPAAQPIVADLFPTALLQPGHSGPLRVVLQRAGATLGATLQARAELAGAGFGVVDDGVRAEPVERTTIYVPEGTAVAKGNGVDVATALGVPAASVRIDARPDALVDVRVVLGADAPFTR